MVELKGSMIVLHGPPKVGKTQFVASMPEPVQFIATEHGHKYIPEKQKKRLVYLPTGPEGWEKFRMMLDKKILIQRKCKSVAVDIVSKLYDRCLEWVCKKNKWEHPQDAGHGKGWHAVQTEFNRGLERLLDQCAELGATVVCIDHTEINEINLSMRQFHKAEVAMSKQPRRVVLPAADHIFFLGYAHMQDVELDSMSVEGNMRWLWIGGNEAIEAGTRAKDVTVKVIKNLPKDGMFDYVCEKLNTKE